MRFVNNISCLYPTYVRGEAYLAAGQGSAAAAEFQKILDHSGIVWNCWTGALAHLGVARANALQAKTSQGADADAARVRALAAYKDFLTLWKDADPDIPILKASQSGVREAAVTGEIPFNRSLIRPETASRSECTPERGTPHECPPASRSERATA